MAAHAVDVLVAALAVPVKPATARPRTQNTPCASARKLRTALSTVTWFQSTCLPDSLADTVLANMCGVRADVIVFSYLCAGEYLCTYICVCVYLCFCRCVHVCMCVCVYTLLRHPTARSPSAGLPKAQLPILCDSSQIWNLIIPHWMFCHLEENSLPKKI